MEKLDAYDVVWKSPSEDASGSMPIGNGEVVLNAWVENSTGDLLFYIGRTDALSEISRVLKLGRVRVHLSGEPFLKPDFSQHLFLHDGRMEISGGGVKLSLFVDSNADVIHISGKSQQPVTTTVSLESWRRGNDDTPFPMTPTSTGRRLPNDESGSAWSLRDAPEPLVESNDYIESLGTGVVCYHKNEASYVPLLWKEQTLESLPGRWDPIAGRIFGSYLQGPNLRSLENGIVTPTGTTTFEASIATVSAQVSSAQEWKGLVAAEAAKSPLSKAQTRTADWWHKFWDRSWVFVETPKDPGIGETVTRGYVLQRYAQACQGRGTYPIKFNGGYFTVEPKKMGKPFNADFRNWGDSVWFQNVRHTVAPMLEQGDSDMMESFFRLYERAATLCEARAKSYYGAEGVYFPETMTDFGTYAGGDYGWDRTGHVPSEVLCPWWATAWNQGPELAMLMLDRYDYTLDESFLKKRALPMAEQVLKYFDTRFKKDDEGRIILDPTQSVETYWTGVINDMPSTAGLRAVSERLCALPARLLTSDQKTFFEHMRKSCPELPLKKVDAGQELAPAQKYDPQTSNCENPELYAVWPFRLVTVGKPDLMAAARLAYANRINHLDVGWGYDGNVAALLGMTDEAARILVVKCNNSHEGYRWPATWGPNFDWLPDQNHGGNLLNTCNLMLLQSEPLDQGGQIRLMPAWPKDWNVDFKLWATGKAAVQCRYRDGKVESLTVSPDARAKDLVR